MRFDQYARRVKEVHVTDEDNGISTSVYLWLLRTRNCPIFPSLRKFGWSLYAREISRTLICVPSPLLRDVHISLGTLDHGDSLFFSALIERGNTLDRLRVHGPVTLDCLWTLARYTSPTRITITGISGLDEASFQA